MKKILLIITFTFLLLLSSCGKQVETKPDDTNLEFWITEDVTNFDFSNYQEKLGSSTKRYYGTGYKPSYDDKNKQIDPDRVVIYTVSNYPKDSSKTVAITSIEITDPDIHFYNLDLSSSHEDIISTLINVGYKVKEEQEDTIVMIKNKVQITFTSKKIVFIVQIDK